MFLLLGAGGHSANLGELHGKPGTNILQEQRFREIWQKQRFSGKVRHFQFREAMILHERVGTQGPIR